MPRVADMFVVGCQLSYSHLLFEVKILWRRAGQHTPVFWPGGSHGQRSLVGYSPQGHKESDTTEQLSTAWHIVQVV